MTLSAEQRFAFIALGHPAGVQSMPVPGAAPAAFRRHLLGEFAAGAQLDESLPKIINAVYLIVRRYLHGRWMYVSERMDDRLWENVEDCWCVDSGLALPLYAPQATLSAVAGIDSAAKRLALLALGRPAGVIVMPPPAAAAIDNRQILAGIYDFPPDYTAEILTFMTDIGVFADYMVGDIIRMGGGTIAITEFVDARTVIGAVIRPITARVPNDPQGMILPAEPGNWTLGVPVTTVSGLNHLEGKLVSILADGSPLPPQTVVDGTITLARAASSVVAGLAFQAQVQTLYWDAAMPTTVQGRRKSVYNVVARVQNTPGPFQLGTNQPDASVQPNQATVAWANMTPVNPPFGSASPQQPYQFFSGDIFADVADSLGTDTAQVAAQQLLPLPLNLIALVPWVDLGDDPGS